jgi:PPOX class probable F420-dependent enzyme
MATPSDPSTNSFASLGDEPFVLLTTFRRSGVGVPTTVWAAREGDTVLVLTPDESGKVKRLRNSGRVELQPCGRSGKVKPGTPVTAGHAELLTAEQDVQRVIRIFRAKYRGEFAITMFIERIFARRQKPRVAVRITAVTPPAAQVA